jgi:hypothetical protein
VKNAVIVVPYRGSSAWREAGETRRRNWEYARAWWSELGLPIFIGDSPANARFDVTKARNAALALATQMNPDWDVALMTDADAVLGSLNQAKAALGVAFATRGYVAAHSELRYLSPRGAAYAERGYAITEAAVEMTIAETWETVFAFPRDLWEEIGGFDPRFSGFGHQVEAFFHAATTLRGNDRITGPCYHFWHPYSADSPHPALKANRALVERYWEAADNEAAMRELVSEYVVAV